MSDLSTARVCEQRANDPVNSRETINIPYRGAFKSPDAQVYRSQVKDRFFHYEIKSKLTRHHSNPPIWNTSHPHDFIVSIKLVSIVAPSDMYGVDMIEAENTLKSILDNIPGLINDLIPSGTTEAIAQYVLENYQLSDTQVNIVSVSVSETPERTTTLFKL